MNDPYNWLDVTNPRAGYHHVETPRTRDEVRQLISHVNEKDQAALDEAFEEGYKLGGVKLGLQFIQDTAAQWRTNKQYVPKRKG